MKCNAVSSKQYFELMKYEYATIVKICNGFG